MGLLSRSQNIHHNHILISKILVLSVAMNTSDKDRYALAINTKVHCRCLTQTHNNAICNLSTWDIFYTEIFEFVVVNLSVLYSDVCGVIILSFKYGNARFTGILDFRSYIVQGRVKVMSLSFKYRSVYRDFKILRFQILHFGSYFVEGW